MISEKRKNKIKKVVSSRQSGLIVVLEDIYDPHNAAAVLRTCDAFGIQDVYFIFDKQKPFNPRKVGKVSSSSANKWLDFHKYKSTSECLEDIKKQGFEVVATILDDEAEDIFKADLTGEKVALFFGNEHAGLSDTAIELADRKIYIPMRGFVQSLNLSVTAAICMFEVTRQRNSLNYNFRFNNTGQEKLYDEFISK